MTAQPRVSVVIETITTRSEGAKATLAEDLAKTLAGLKRQTYPWSLIEPIVVLDAEVNAGEGAELRRLHPDLVFITSPKSSYPAAKNAGGAAASGSIVAWLDGDCEPALDWLETMVRALGDGADVVAGKTRYPSSSSLARTFSITSFGGVMSNGNNEATAFNANNVGFRRESLIDFPFDERVTRHGSCYLLFAQLRAAGKRIIYCPAMQVSHGTGDVADFGFVRKHFERGYDGLAVHGLDHAAVLRGTPVIRRFGPIGLIALSGRRVWGDWKMLIRHRSEVRWVNIPVQGALALLLRTIELVGSLAAYAQGHLWAHDERRTRVSTTAQEMIQPPEPRHAGSNSSS